MLMQVNRRFLSPVSILKSYFTPSGEGFWQTLRLLLGYKYETKRIFFSKSFFWFFIGVLHNL